MIVLEIAGGIVLGFVALAVLIGWANRPTTGELMRKSLEGIIDPRRED
jgi:hypothetical protein